MNEILLAITIVGYLLALFFVYKFQEEKNKRHCPRCGRVWKESKNDADTVYHCKKCGLVTYDSRRYLATFEDRSENY